ncbi:hypothetical protein KBD87_02395 [Candidatus Saccharibacteria bacterium]|nr:hypothetical protein [Candidatus Saccharibacteria bacterium]
MPAQKPPHETYPAIESPEVVNLLYKKGGIYDQFAEIFDDYGQTSDDNRATTLAEYSPELGLAARACKVGTRGLISVTIAETLRIIDEKRWTHRLILPPRFDIALVSAGMYVTEHNGGQFSSTIEPVFATYLVDGKSQVLPIVRGVDGISVDRYVTYASEILTDLRAIHTA